MGNKQSSDGKRNLRSAHFLLFFLFGMLIIFLSGAAAEKPYPNRPINLIVAYAPGGIMDLGGTVIADKITEFLGQPVIRVYKPGGGGSLGTSYFTKSKADGYTIYAGSTTPCVLLPIVRKLDYSLENFIPLGIYGETPVWLAVKNDAKWKSLKDFVEDAKKQPEQLRVSSYGRLTAVDFAIEFLSRQAKIKLTHVPYKSSGEALTAVLGGHAEAAMVTGAGGLLESGSIRILALAGERRLEDLPDVPTFKEEGYPFVLSAWQSFCALRGTPKEAVDKLYEAQKKAFEKYRKEIREGLRKVEIWPIFLDPQESMNKFREMHDLVSKIANDLGVAVK